MVPKKINHNIVDSIKRISSSNTGSGSSSKNLDKLVNIDWKNYWHTETKIKLNNLIAKPM